MREVPEVDATLRRIERDALLACAVMAAVAWAVTRGRVDAALGVVAGGLLIAISYRGIKSGIDVLVEAASGGARRTAAAIGLVKFFTRYAILAGAAYLIMARLQLPPLAVFAGASSLVVAVTVEALRGVASRQR